ncbi:ethanolamine utilization phosphate acetyltransferase EutD [Jeotgalibaca caeni]|uniref:ethanolamine utilization phosphate acetyltransferase EutD n=1 Tax=Jeotgalibaca caeni TaxID=3028623 RepID=UPI00237EC89D|nr:ethanolamine utilization phosphate acetyltransferase EutD [Jeotgalibaca caeni]MDE1548751.1 ethanolamine utilization phosphate acetyltransferase EutD [Jeotgalibaca caeni]
MTISFDQLIEEVAVRVKANMEQTFEIEASGRHVHLSQEHIDILFGKNHKLLPTKYLSQPGQFAGKERVTLVGPKGVLHQVVVLGPARDKSQVEISFTDAQKLGVRAPLRLSGDTKGTPGIMIMVGNKHVILDEGLIVAKRHIHVKEQEAARLNVKDKEVVKVQVMSERPLIFDDVVVRVSPKFETFMHIDYDEANACGFKSGTKGRIIKKD